MTIHLILDPQQTGWYSELQGWQGGIAALLGLLGLVLGALYNAHLNRNRDDRQRRYEAKAVAAGLYGEMLHLRSQLCRMANGVGDRFLDAEFQLHPPHNPYDRAFLSWYPLPAPALYSKIADKVGLLAADTAGQVVSFYAQYELAKSMLPQLENDPIRGFSINVSYVLVPALEALDQVDLAMNAIEGLLDLKPADVTKPTRARDAMEHLFSTSSEEDD